MIKIVKKETGNVFIYKGGRLESTLQPDASITLLSYADGIAILDDSGQSFDLVTSSVSETQIEPAGSTPFNGTTQELIELLAESFFFITGSGGGGGGVPVGQILYMRLNSSQDLNVIQPFTDLDFVEVTNTIPNASVSSNFPIGPQTYRGVVTLPAGKYKTSYRINCNNGSNTQKVIVTNISRYAPSVIFYPESTTYEMFRNLNPASIVNSDANYEFLNLTQAESFGIISTRVAAAGACNSIPEQSFWKIEKIG